MKNSLILALLIMMTVGIFARGALPDTTTENVNSSSYTVKISVKGMVCSFCAQGIKKSFEKVLGEKNITVNVSEDFSNIILFISNNIKISDNKITEIIIDSGYTVGKIMRN